MFPFLIVRTFAGHKAATRVSMEGLSGQLLDLGERAGVNPGVRMDYGIVEAQDDKAAEEAPNDAAIWLGSYVMRRRRRMSDRVGAPLSGIEDRSPTPPQGRPIVMVRHKARP